MALVRGKSPYRFLAIVHDFNLTPSWRRAWVKGALEDIFYKVNCYSLKTMGLPLLATIRGSLAAHEYINILFEVLESSNLEHLNKIFLIVSEYEIDEVVNAISERINSHFS